MIPKILHFTWKTADLPRYLGRYYRSWQRVSPGWDIQLWTDAAMRDFVVERYPALLATYDAYPRNIQRADIFRYMVLGALGGVYADLDVEALRPIDSLLGLEAFVGIEPFEHVGPDRRHAGIGYMLSNAFMGSVPAHPLWRRMLELAPEAALGNVFESTGPVFLHAAVLRMQKAERPTGLLPQVWSPRRDGGRPACVGAGDIERVHRKVDVYSGDGRPLVSHDWLTTWVPWHIKHHGWTILYRWPTVLKWRLRERRMPRIDARAFPATQAVYDDQVLDGDDRSASVRFGLYLPAGAAWNAELPVLLAGLDYPHDRLSVALYTADPAGADIAALGAGLHEHFADVRVVGSDEPPILLRNRILADGAAVADRVLLVAGDIRAIPAESLLALANSGTDVVVPRLAGDGLETYRYAEPPSFRYLYKQGSLDGVLRPDRDSRSAPGSNPTFRLLPVDGVSPRFLLISANAIKAGVRFAETPYKFHLDGDGLPLVARDLGFEAAVRNDIVVG